jgi:hypothetical protein
LLLLVSGATIFYPPLAPLIACCPQRLPQLNPVNSLVRLFPAKRAGASYLVSGLLLPPTHFRRRPAASGAAYRLSPIASCPVPPSTRAGQPINLSFTRYTCWFCFVPVLLALFASCRPPAPPSHLPLACASYVCGALLASQIQLFSVAHIPHFRRLLIVARTTTIADSIETTKYIPRISRRQCLLVA